MITAFVIIGAIAAFIMMGLGWLASVENSPAKAFPMIGAMVAGLISGLAFFAALIAWMVS